MPVRGLVRDPALFKQLHQRRSAHAEQVCGLLGCESQRVGSDGDRLPTPQRHHDIGEQAAQLIGHGHAVAVRAGDDERIKVRAQHRLHLREGFCVTRWQHRLLLDVAHESSVRQYERIARLEKNVSGAARLRLQRDGWSADDIQVMEAAPIYDDLVRAGASAKAHADSLEPLIESTARQIATLQQTMAALRQRQRHFKSGSEGERQAAAAVHQVLVDLNSTDWHLLADRRWPGTRNANLDLILIGPPGVLLLDAKNWKEPDIRAGSLWRGQSNEDDALDKSRRAADAVADVLAGLGLAPIAVRPFIVFVGLKRAARELQGVTLIGEKSLSSELVRLPRRLDSAQVGMLTAAVDENCPPASVLWPPQRRVVRRDAPASSGVDGNDTLIDTQEIWDAAVEAATREPIESWMTWLHPAQSQLVTRRYSGPARIRGAAGTGKTVVALHRVRELAKRPGSRVFVTSFVNTLPQVQESLFNRLAPDLARRVEFLGLHKWAVRLLRDRGTIVRVADDGRREFEAAWSDVGASGVLGSSAVPASYWRDEICHVIKGRGLVDVDDYLGLVRVGRRTPLREEQRRAMWELYQAYQQNLRDADESDWADVMSLAFDSVLREPVMPAYTAVVADEVQDLSCVGIRLLHALVGDAPDGLLLVGDGQQAVYPGGYTLSEAGVSVTGRATVLNRNYRNATEIFSTALEIVRSDLFDDLDTDSLPGARNVIVDRQGGVVVARTTRSFVEQRSELIRALQAAIADGVGPGEIAVLVKFRRDVETWLVSLNAADILATSLADYDGKSSDAVKVGTYQRAKGLEFACVFLPDYDRAIDKQTETETEEAYRERAELQRRQLFVAMTRARDRLWLGSRG